MSPEEKAKADEIYKAIIGKERNSLVNRYGKDAEKVAKGRAIKQAQKLAEKKMNSSKDKLREMVKNALMNEKAGFTDKFDNDPALKGGQKNLPDGLQKSIISKAKGKMEEMLNRDSITQQAKVYAQEKYPQFGLSDKDIEFFVNTYSSEIKDEPSLKSYFDDFVDSEFSLDEDLDLGHEDNEPHMIKAELYRIGKYAMELYQMVDQFEGQGEVDFPAWWQAKITSAKDMISSAKHYLDFELKEPEIDAMVGAIDMEDKKALGISEGGSDGDFEDQEENKRMAYRYYDKGQEAYSEGDFLKADQYRTTALRYGSYLGWTDNELPPYKPVVDEKKLTKPELKKREEIAKAMEKGNPKMDMEKKMAIATSIAKRVAEKLMDKK